MTSVFFRASEFRCKDAARTPYPEAWVDTRLQALCTVLDVVRSHWGGPLRVISGYRTPAYNAAIGGARKSEHVEGRAADVAPRDATPEMVQRLYDQVLRLYHDGKVTMLGGIGIYPSWVHLDVRPRPPDGHLARWDGVGIGSEVT